MSKIDKYFLPDEINSVSELLASEDFKNFVKENPPSKAGAEALSVMNKSKDPDFLLLGEHRAGQLVIRRYLKNLSKTQKKKFKYNFLRAYEGFSINKNN